MQHATKVIIDDELVVSIVEGKRWKASGDIVVDLLPQCEHTLCAKS